MVQVTLHCPFCGSDDVGKNGSSNGKQRYLCRNTGCPHKTFYAEYTYYPVHSNFVHFFASFAKPFAFFAVEILTAKYAKNHAKHARKSIQF